MKKILLACDKRHIDQPLRRSLGHLLKCCQIEVVHTGELVFDELYRQAFDLIIIDFEISGADSLELVESIQYIDPGVPVILLLTEAHRPMWEAARQVKAHPAVRPFNPIKFLRLVDKLLHQQLNRYRRLADLLAAALDSLCAQTSSPCALLVEETGQVLTSVGEIESLSAADLGPLVIDYTGSGADSGTPAALPVAGGQGYGLYVAEITENLRLILAAQVDDGPPPDDIWPDVEAAACQIDKALHSHAPANGTDATGYDPTADRRWYIPLASTFTDEFFEVAPNAGEDEDCPEEADEVAVNWAIIQDNSDLLSRLHEFCQID